MEKPETSPGLDALHHACSPGGADTVLVERAAILVMCVSRAVPMQLERRRFENPRAHRREVRG